MSIVESPWLSARAAAIRAGISVHRLHNMAVAGLIRTKIEPGATPKYSAEDADRLRDEQKGEGGTR
jgi:predicted site-specific integrase-resolvase